jgi:26S proteasome regulatory subunit N11
MDVQRMMAGMRGGGGGPPADAVQVDTAEQIYISSLALLKMLKHGAPGPLTFLQLRPNSSTLLA